MYYMRRNDIGISVFDGIKDIMLNTGLKKYINTLCMENLSTYEGRRQAVINLLNERDNIPIYIDEYTFLYPTKSLREYNMMFVNYNEVLSYRKVDSKHTLLIFKNLDELIIEVTVTKVRKQHKRIEIISNYFQNII